MDVGRLFEGILDEKNLSSKTTSGKLMYCLEKGVFYPYKRGFTYSGNKIESANFAELDLSEFDSLPFEIDRHYRTEKHSISLVDDAVEEIFNAFQCQVELWSLMDEIDFNLNILSTPDEKIKYLRSVLLEIKPLELKNLYVFYCSSAKNLRLDYGYEFEFLNNSKKYAFEYLIGRVHQGMMFDSKAHPELLDFAMDYSIFVKARRCYEKIQIIKEHTEIEPSPFQNSENKNKLGKKYHPVFQNKDVEIEPYPFQNSENKNKSGENYHPVFQNKDAEMMLHRILLHTYAIETDGAPVRGKFRQICDGFYKFSKELEIPLLKRSVSIQQFINFLNIENGYNAKIKTPSRIYDSSNKPDFTPEVKSAYQELSKDNIEEQLN